MKKITIITAILLTLASCKTQVVYTNKYDQLSHKIEDISHIYYIGGNRKSEKTFRERNINLRREILESNDSIFQNIDSTYFILFEVCDYDWTHSNWNLIAIDDKRFLYEKDDFFKDYKIENYDKDNSDFEFCIDMIKKDDLENLFKENHSDCMQDTHIFIINSKNLKIIRYIKVDCFSDPYHELEGS